MSSSNLSKSAMLASLTIRRWQGTLTDRKVSGEVATAHNVTERRAGKYRKHAIDVDAPSFRAVLTASSDLRHKHYWHTLPWGQDGARILTATNFDTYSTDIRHLTALYDEAARAFVRDFPRLKESAKRELNGLYNEDDYPRDIARKFGVDLSIMPLPDAKDFRVALSQEAVKQIRGDIEAELQRTTSAAMQEPYQRLYDHVARMVERLSDPENTFRDSLVTGLAELCAVLPGLNLTGDARLSELTTKAAALIAGIDAKQLRDVPAIRADVAKRAAEIQNVMGAFMGVAQS